MLRFALYEVYAFIFYFFSYDSVIPASDVDGEVEEPPNPDRCLKVKKSFVLIP